jgi:hypothetical protein
MYINKPNTLLSPLWAMGSELKFRRNAEMGAVQCQKSLSAIIIGSKIGLPKYLTMLAQCIIYYYFFPLDQGTSNRRNFHRNWKRAHSIGNWNG